MFPPGPRPGRDAAGLARDRLAGPASARRPRGAPDTAERLLATRLDDERSADARPALRKRELFAENIGEAAFACLVTMVQGNLLALSIGHWLIASRTGLLAGAATSLAVLIIRIRSRWTLALALGLLTTIVDYIVHPGQFGPAVLEAIVTGAGAGVLSLLVGAIVRAIRARRRARTGPAG